MIFTIIPFFPFSSLLSYKLLKSYPIRHSSQEYSAQRYTRTRNKENALAVRITEREKETERDKKDGVDGMDVWEGFKGEGEGRGESEARASGAEVDRVYRARKGSRSDFSRCNSTRIGRTLENAIIYAIPRERRFYNRLNFGSLDITPASPLATVLTGKANVCSPSFGRYPPPPSPSLLFENSAVRPTRVNIKRSDRIFETKGK